MFAIIILICSDSKCSQSATKRPHWKGFWVGRTAFSRWYGTQFLSLSYFSRSQPKSQSRLKPHFESLLIWHSLCICWHHCASLAASFGMEMHETTARQGPQRHYRSKLFLLISEGIVWLESRPWTCNGASSSAIGLYFSDNSRIAVQISSCLTVNPFS